MTDQFVRDLFEKNLLLNPITREADVSTTKSAVRYATTVGRVLNRTLEQAVDSGYTISEGFAEELLRPLMNRSFLLCADASKASQNALNAAWGYGIQAQMPQSGDKIDKVVELASRTEPGEVLRAIRHPVDTFGRQVIADGSAKHVNLLGRSGIQMVAIRVNDNKGLHGGKDRCEYCDTYAGEWVYPNIPNEVWGFHDGCGCSLTYIRKNGDVEQIR